MYKNGNTIAELVIGKPVYALTGSLLFLVISNTLNQANLIKPAVGNNTTNNKGAPNI